MSATFSPATEVFLAQAQESAREIGLSFISSELCLWRLCQLPDSTNTIQALQKVGLQIAWLMSQAERTIEFSNDSLDETAQVPYTQRFERMLEDAQRHAIGVGSDLVEPEHILIAMLESTESVGGKLLQEARVDQDAFVQALLALSFQFDENDDTEMALNYHLTGKSMDALMQLGAIFGCDSDEETLTKVLEYVRESKGIT